MAAVRRALRDAQLEREEVKGVVMVGGSTRMPQVQRAVAEFFGREPLTNLNPDEVVALWRSHPGQPARREQHRRRLAVAGRDPAVAGH